MSADEARQPFGRKPGERVYPRGRFAPPPVRTRAAPLAKAGRLAFEQEVEGQKEALARALAGARAPEPGLAFEPEAAGPAERLSSALEGAGAPSFAPSELRRAPSSVALAKEDAPAADEDTEQLLDIAAGRAEAPATEPSTGIHRTGTGTDSQTAGNQSRSPPAASHGLPGALARPTDSPALTCAGEAPERPPARSTSRLNWISVFLSEKVAGRRRRRRRSSAMLRRSGTLLAVAERAAGRWSRRVGGALSRVDAVTRRARLPLANIFWGAVVAGIAMLLGVAPPWAGAFFAASLILTVAGQPARNLLGFAGIMISAAALAEIVRQRDRFFEIFMSFFG